MSGRQFIDEGLLRQIYSFLVPRATSASFNPHRGSRKSRCMQVARGRPFSAPSFTNFRRKFGTDLSKYKRKSWVTVQCGEWRTFRGMMESLHLKELRAWMKENPDFLADVPVGPEFKKVACKHIRWSVTRSAAKVHAKQQHCEQDIDQFLVKLAECIASSE